jgi:sensory rhodopsin
MGLALVTQYTFIITMLGMAAASVYFILERDTLTPRYRSTATVAAIYTGIAAANYYFMHTIVGMNGKMESINQLPTAFRYIDWIITTPLMLVKFPQLLVEEDDAKGVAFVLIVADLLMILFGLFGELAINAGGTNAQMIGWACFGVGMIAWLMLIFVIYSIIGRASSDKLAPIQQGYKRMRMFIVVGWSIYPIGYIVALAFAGQDAKIARELIYNIADLVNKVGFGLAALFAVRQAIREEEIRAAIDRM